MDIDRIVNQLKKDEGFRPTPYWDNKQWTFGYGCKAPGPKAHIAELDAAVLLDTRARQSVAEFAHMFEYNVHKFNEVRQEAFINILFNMGPGNPKRPGDGGLASFVNTLRLILAFDDPNWKDVVDNMRQSKWYRQTGNRAKRICLEIETGERSDA